MVQPLTESSRAKKLIRNTAGRVPVSEGAVLGTINENTGVCEMKKKEVTELKRRLKRETVSFSRMAGCYVDAEKHKVTSFNQSFLNLEDDEFSKYLEIANKVLSGKLGNNLLELEFPMEEEREGGRQQLLMALRNTAIEQESVLDRFYDHVIETYDFVGNYLILLFHDVYDVMSRSSDNIDLDESAEAFDYILCAICPVALSKPGLGYREEDNSIAARIRDWVVGPVDTGFLFPSFDDRTTDIHHVLMYAKNVREPHKEFWENGMGCLPRLTATEKKDAFGHMVCRDLSADQDAAEDMLLEVQSNLSDFIAIEEDRREDEEPLVLTREDLVDILRESGMEDDRSESVGAKFEDFFQEEIPVAEELLDTKLLKDNEIRKEKKNLQKKVVELTDQLESAGVIARDGKSVDVVVKVPDERLDEVETTFVDGRKCLVIPLEADDQATLNGEDYLF